MFPPNAAACVLVSCLKYFPRRHTNKRLQIEEHAVAVPRLRVTRHTSCLPSKPPMSPFTNGCRSCSPTANMPRQHATARENASSRLGMSQRRRTASRLPSL